MTDRPAHHIKGKFGRETGLPFTDADHNIFAWIAAELGLPGVWAWGSRTRGWWVEESDYDVLVPTDSQAETQRMLAVAASLSTQLGRKVDLLFNHPPYDDAVWVEAAKEAAFA